MHSRLNNCTPRMRCLECGGALREHDVLLTCVSCAHTYTVKDGVIYCTDYFPMSNEGQGTLTSFLKESLKRFPRVYYIVTHFFGASMTGVSSKKFYLTHFNSFHVVLNIGAGVKRIHAGITNVDISPYGPVDIVADMRHLPFKDTSVDGVICEDVLEHVNDPVSAVKEMYRVLSPGGKVFISVPFIFHYHKSPQEDYYRWTKQGLRELTRDFKELHSGPRHGPTSALILVLISWISMVLSLGSARVFEFFFIILTIVFAPWCHIVDPLLSRFPTASNMTSGFYFIGKKE